LSAASGRSGGSATIIGTSVITATTIDAVPLVRAVDDRQLVVGLRIPPAG